MALTRVKTWVAGEVLTANDLNNEFNNIINNAISEPFVATQSVDLNGHALILDDDGNTTIDGLVNDTINIKVNGSSDFTITPNTFTAVSGSSLVLASGDVQFTAGRVLYAKGADVASASTITAPTDSNTFDVTGVVTITAISATQAGTMFYARFTGAGLNITYNATSMITPWAQDYRTVPNEVLCFWSLGSGHYIFWSLNGPKERVGVTIEANVSSAPAGYLDEDGSAVSRTTYSGLFGEVGTTYGAGNGTTTFNVPDSRGRVSINVDGAANRITAASTNGGNADTLGGVGGAETHTLQTAEMPSHTHTESQAASAAVAAGYGAAATPASGNTGSTGGGGAHSNTQPWIAKKKFIRF